MVYKNLPMDVTFFAPPPEIFHLKIKLILDQFRLYAERDCKGNFKLPSMQRFTKVPIQGISGEG